MDFLKASGPINSHLNHHLENHCNWYSSKSANTYLSTSVYTYCMYNYYEGTCRRSLLYLLEAPVLGPWAHLGFHYISDPNVFLKSILRDQNVDIRKNSNSPEESHDPITGWWFETFFIFPFHIWDVILPIDFHSIIFQAVFGLAPGIPVRPRYDLYGARQTMLLSTASLGFCGLVRCLPLRGQGFMVLVQLSMCAGGLEQMSCLRWKIYVKSVVFVGNLLKKSEKPAETSFGCGREHILRFVGK